MTELTQQRKEFEAWATKEGMQGTYMRSHANFVRDGFYAGYEAGRSSLESENARLREALKKNDICVKCLKRFSGKHCESV